jgi:hypothetical protein
MIQGLAAHSRRLDEDVHLRFDIRLPDVIGKRFGAHCPIDDFVVAAPGTGDDAVLFDAHARF